MPFVRSLERNASSDGAMNVNLGTPRCFDLEQTSGKPNLDAALGPPCSKLLAAHRELAMASDARRLSDSP